MVSKAKDDLPDPESPVNTMRLLRGRSTEISRRLCSRAPRTTRRSWSYRGGVTVTSGTSAIVCARTDSADSADKYRDLMNTSSHLSDNLSLLAHETSLLMRTAVDLDDEAIRHASLCEGWSRAHVLSHIARNADGLGNLVGWAITGTPRAMYDWPEARDADIAAGATRGAQEILTDLKDSAARFAAAAAGLAGAPEQAEVELSLIHL